MHSPKQPFRRQVELNAVRIISDAHVLYIMALAGKRSEKALRAHICSAVLNGVYREISKSRVVIMGALNESSNFLLVCLSFIFIYF